MNSDPAAFIHIMDSLMAISGLGMIILFHHRNPKLARWTIPVAVWAVHLLIFLAFSIAVDLNYIRIDPLSFAVWKEFQRLHGIATVVWYIFRFSIYFCKSSTLDGINKKGDWHGV